MQGKHFLPPQKATRKASRRGLLGRSRPAGEGDKDAQASSAVARTNPASDEARGDATESATPLAGSRAGKQHVYIVKKHTHRHHHRHHHHHRSSGEAQGDAAGVMAPAAESPTGERHVYIVREREHRHHHRRSRNSRGSGHQRRWVTVALSLVILAVPIMVSIAWLWSLAGRLSVGPEREPLKGVLVTEKEAKEESQNNGYYVLLVGSDAREGDVSSRGDVLILTRIDTEAREVTLVSIPRDTMVKIAGAVGPQKINAAYAYGGASSAIYEISRFAGVDLSHYAEVDFNGLIELVDALGGVWVNVPETVKTKEGSIEAGPQRLNGAQALALARERYTATGGDFGRTRAQRLVVEAIMRQLLESPPAEIPGLIQRLAGCVSTDYSIIELLSLASAMAGGKVVVYSAICPSYAYWQDGVAYAGTMYDEWSQMMKRVDAGQDPNADTDIPEPQNSSTRLGSAENALSPRDYHELADENMTTDVVGEMEPVAMGGSQE